MDHGHVSFNHVGRSSVERCAAHTSIGPRLARCACLATRMQELWCALCWPRYVPPHPCVELLALFAGGPGGTSGGVWQACKRAGYALAATGCRCVHGAGFASAPCFTPAATCADLLAVLTGVRPAAMLDYYHERPRGAALGQPLLVQLLRECRDVFRGGCAAAMETRCVQLGACVFLVRPGLLCQRLDAAPPLFTRLDAPQARAVLLRLLRCGPHACCCAVQEPRWANTEEAAAASLACSARPTCACLAGSRPVTHTRRGGTRSRRVRDGAAGAV